MKLQVAGLKAASFGYKAATFGRSLAGEFSLRAFTVSVYQVKVAKQTHFFFQNGMHMCGIKWPNES